ELRGLARQRGIRGYSRMRKAELQQALDTPQSVPVLPPMTVAQLRQVLRDAGVRGPSNARKADRVRMMRERPPAAPVKAAKKAAPRVARARPGSTIGDVELGPTQLDIAMGDAPPFLRRPPGDFRDRPIDGPSGLIVHRGER